MGFTPIPTFPPEGGRGLQGTAGMGPRMREDTRTGECCRGWDSPPSQPSLLKGEGVYRGQRGWVPACANRTYGGVLSGMGFTPIPTFPPEGGRGLQGTAGMGPRMREPHVRGSVVGDGIHPHPNLPPLKGEGVYRGQRGWVPACARTHVRGSVVGDGIHPHPNLPP